jgi:hypothetical protein
MKLTLALFTLLALTSLRQEEKARGILDKSSEKMSEITSFYTEVNINIKNNSVGMDKNETSKSWVKGDKYFALFGENTIISDGISNWTIIKEEKTIYKTDVEEEDEIINPRKLLTLWETGFRYKYGEETILNNEAVHLIFLYPENSGTVDYHTIAVYISESTSELKKSIFRMKDGTLMTYRVTKFISNPPIEDATFIFNEGKYPGYIVIKDS